MSPKKSRKNIFTYVHPILLQIGKVVGVIFILCLVLICAGYKGVGPLDWLFSPPSVNLLVEDTGKYGTLYQTPRQAAKSSVQGFLVTKEGKRKKVNNLTAIIAPELNKVDIPNTDINPTTKDGQVEYSSKVKNSIEGLVKLIQNCDYEGRGAGAPLRQCLCENLDCKDNKNAATVAKQAETWSESVLLTKPKPGEKLIAFECVEFFYLADQFITNSITKCTDGSTASSLSSNKCRSTNNFKCVKSSSRANIQYPIGGFKLGDDIIERITLEKGGTNNDHISLCVEPQSDGSCRVCEANYHNDGKVSCDRIVKPVNSAISTVWRKYSDNTANCW